MPASSSFINRMSAFTWSKMSLKNVACYPENCSLLIRLKLTALPYCKPVHLCFWIKGYIYSGTHPQISFETSPFTPLSEAAHLLVLCPDCQRALIYHIIIKQLFLIKYSDYNICYSFPDTSKLTWLYCFLFLFSASLIQYG